MKEKIMDFFDFPPDFCAGLFSRIFAFLSGSQSLTLVGPSGVGKTLILRLLPKQARIFLPAAAFSYIDCADFPEPPAENLARIRKELILIEKKRERMVVLLDNFWLLAGRPDLLGFLKCWREKQREKTSLVFTLEECQAEKQFLAKFAPLDFLLTENIIFPGPLDKKDAAVFLEKTAALLSFKLPPMLSRQIIFQSGGAPRIIKRLAKLAADGAELGKVFTAPETDEKLRLDLEKIGDFNQKYERKWEIPLMTQLFSRKAPLGGTETMAGFSFAGFLSPQEHTLAKFLLDNSGSLVGREEMMRALWKENFYEASDHALDQALHRLRKKMALASPKLRLLVSRGRGVKLEAF